MDAQKDISMQAKESTIIEESLSVTREKDEMFRTWAQNTPQTEQRPEKIDKMQANTPSSTLYGLGNSSTRGAKKNRFKTSLNGQKDGTIPESTN